jgi:hypothetical protein
MKRSSVVVEIVNDGAIGRSNDLMRAMTEPEEGLAT